MISKEEFEHVELGIKALLIVLVCSEDRTKRAEAARLVVQGLQIVKDEL